MNNAHTELTSGIAAVTDKLVALLDRLTFRAPVTHVYNPLIYARKAYDQYVMRFGTETKRVILVGMNPGPFGMAQTGVPFGDVEMVKDWMGIRASVNQPLVMNPKRPIDGFACRRREVSGSRLWGWAKQRYGTATSFFRQFFVLNYCPLVFMEASGRNRTPDKLPAVEKKQLFSVCDQALRQSVRLLQPRCVVGIGGFAEKRCQYSLSDLGVAVGRITHPSPANPRANRGWGTLVDSELASMGIGLPDGGQQAL